MTMDEPIKDGDRWRRIAAPRDHVWVLSHDDHSVSYRTRTGTASAPTGNFRRMFVYDPKKVK